LWIQFLASTKNWRTYWRLSESVENKKEKAELEKEMERTTPQSFGRLIS